MAAAAVEAAVWFTPAELAAAPAPAPAAAAAVVNGGGAAAADDEGGEGKSKRALAKEAKKGALKPPSIRRPPGCYHCP